MHMAATWSADASRLTDANILMYVRTYAHDAETLEAVADANVARETAMDMT